MSDKSTIGAINTDYINAISDATWNDSTMITFRRALKTVGLDTVNFYNFLIKYIDSSVSGNSGALETAISQINTTISNLSKNLNSEIDSNNDSLNIQISSINKQIKGLNDNINTITNNIETLNKNDQTIVKAINDIYKYLNVNQSVDIGTIFGGSAIGN